MSEQVFVSYRRTGGDVSAKLIAEALKNQGFTVFYDFDSLHGGYFDTRIIDAIEGCDDFVLVLPENGLDRCVNDDDWVRQEIRAAAKNNKNIIPISLPNFVFPNNLPDDIAFVSRINAVPFSMPFFDAMISTIVDRMRACPSVCMPNAQNNFENSSVDLSMFDFGANGDGTYAVRCLVNNMKSIVVPDKYNGRPVTKISNNAFSNSKELREISIPASIKIIGDEAFKGCDELTRVELPVGLEEIGKNAFDSCWVLQSILIPNTVKFIGAGAFKSCWELGNVQLPGNLTEIADELFYRCEKINEVRIPENVISIGERAFEYCSSLKNIFIPSSVKTIGYSAFSNCISLEEVGLPDSLDEISGRMFEECTNLRYISIPDGVKIICGYAFSGCSSLTSQRLGSSLQVIGERAFYGCNAMDYVVIPSTVTEVGARAFEKCRPSIRVIWVKYARKKARKGRGAFPIFAKFTKY